MVYTTYLTLPTPTHADASTQQVHGMYKRSHDIMFREHLNPPLPSPHKSTCAPGPVVSLSKAPFVGKGR